MNTPRERERIDLQSFKEKLKLILKDNAAEYWACLKKFTQAKLSKIEMDANVKKILGSEENIALHNLFIKSIFINAYCSRAPTLSPSQQIQAKSWTGVSMKSAKKDRIGRRRKGKEGEETGGSEIVQQVPASAMAPLQSFFFINTPQMLALRNRMYKRATENGITHVASEAVVLMDQAMEFYMKRILSQIKIKGKPLPAVTQSSSGFSQTDSSAMETITPLDMLDMALEKPYLLGEDASMNTERIAMTLS